MFQTTRYTFEEVKLPGEKVCKCTGCGKRLVRRNTFSQTINPFNKNKAGGVKGRAEIFEELERDRAKWMKEPEVCGRCEQDDGDE